MKYIIMECKLGYAIAMDTDGRFLKVVNLDYEVGQEVDEVLTFELEDKKQHRKALRRFSIVLAACLCIFFYGAYQMLFVTYGTVKMQINPDILIKVNRFHYVIDLEGLNQDGKNLIHDYSHRFKKLTVVSEELTERAIQFGYLTHEGTISIEVSSEHADWESETETELIAELTSHFSGNIHVSSPENVLPEIPLNHDQIDDNNRVDVDKDNDRNDNDDDDDDNDNDDDDDDNDDDDDDDDDNDDDDDDNDD